MYLEFCEYPFRKRGGFFGKHLKKIPKCIWNLWISIPEKRRIFCEALEENCQVYSEFVNIYSTKEVDFSWSAWRNFLSVLRICEYPLPKKRRNIMYYYYIFSLRVGGRVFFSPSFCGRHLATIKKKACNSYKGFFFLKGIPQICQILRKEQFEIVI